MRSVEDLLIREEGEKLSAYQDSLGFWTIGVGRLIDSRRGGGISKVEARYLLDNDVARIRRALRSRYTWFSRLDEVREAVVISMAFQTGEALHKWPKFCNAMAVTDYTAAAKEMLDSIVAREQAPLRWNRQAHMMLTGQWGT